MASPDSHIKELNENLYKSAFDNLSKFELEGAQAKITLLSEQLEAKEKAELEVKTEVAKLQAQVEQLNLNKQVKKYFLKHFLSLFILLYLFTDGRN